MASRSPERARELLAPYPQARVFSTYEELLADPGVDAVYNPLPNSLHKEWTIRALEAGKHVLCEKPIALDAREAEEMAAAAVRTRKHLMEAFMYRFHPGMREFVGGLSEPLHLHAMFGFTARDPNDIRLQAAMGGGALYDVGSYAVSVSRWILGDPSDVVGSGRFQNGIDTSITGLLSFPGGATASVWASVESPEVQDLMVITRSGVARRSQPFSAYKDPHDPYQLMVESFGRSVIDGTPVELPLTESIANMRTLDRIRAAAKPSPAP